MILETIVITVNNAGEPHIAPMGIHTHDDELVILPFRPSTTLDNLVSNKTAVINFCDDVRVFAGCLTNRRNWPLSPTESFSGYVLASALAHSEVEVVRIEDDPIRPKFFCRTLREVNHAPFKGFNRAQFAVLEAAILVSRLSMLPLDRIKREVDYLTTGFEKTAGPREREAWNWLMEHIDAYKHGMQP